MFLRNLQMTREYRKKKQAQEVWRSCKDLQMAKK